MEILKGIPVSPGFAIAEAFVIASRNLDIPRRFINENEVERERERFFEAVKVAQEDIRALQRRMDPEIGGEAAPIFDAHVMILADSSLHDEVMRRIVENRFSAEYAVSRSLRKFEKAFYAIDDKYLAQRVADIQDIEQRLLRALLGERAHDLEDLKKRVVLVAHNLTPSEIASIDPNYVMGFCTDVGGSTGHTAIVARAMEIPAVVGLRGISTDISQGDTIIIDGNRGVVIINPDSETIIRYRGIADDFHQFEQALYSERDLPTVTTDGVSAIVMGNIEFPKEIEQVVNSGGKGVALYRTEFLYLASKKAPDEEAHYQAYCNAIKHLKGRPLTIRTLDLGADKFFQKEAPMHENNPQLGCRAIRYCLMRPDIFRTQIRAICRASAYGDIKMMIPMVSATEEVKRTLDLLREIQDELAADDIPFNEEMSVGIMVETPAVAITLESYIDLVDFFSIGTNDLIQYTLAVDRTNEHVADLYKPSHPAVLCLVKRIIEISRKHNKAISMCGEMCGDPIFVPFLLGVGLRTFSVPPPLIPEVKKLVRSVSIATAEEIAAKVFTMHDSREISAYLRNTTREIVPDWAFM